MIIKNRTQNNRNIPSLAKIVICISAILAISLACGLITGPQVPTLVPAPSDTSPPEPSPAPPDEPIPPFERAVGNWEGVDLDGSNVTMTITKISTGEYSIHYHDDGATICGKDANGKLYPADGFGTDTTTTNNLLVELELICLTTPPSTWGVLDFEFQYQYSSDTITDSTGVVWH